MDGHLTGYDFFQTNFFNILPSRAIPLRMFSSFAPPLKF